MRVPRHPSTRNRAAGLPSFVRAMDEDTGEFLHALFSEEVVEVSSEEMARDLRHELADVGEEDIGAVTSAMAAALRDALERGRKANPGKGVRLRLR